MGLSILLKDELRGFYKSSIMIILWIGLPLVSFLLHFINFQDKLTYSFSIFFATVVSSLGGTLASILLAVYIVHEKSKNVYALFLVRPIKRSNILFAKFFAVFFCIAIAIIISISLGIFIDYLKYGEVNDNIVYTTFETFFLSLFSISVACSTGILIGVISNSVLVAVLIIVFLTSNLSALAIMLPLLITSVHPLITSGVSSAILTIIFMFASIWDFRRRQF